MIHRRSRTGKHSFAGIGLHGKGASGGKTVRKRRLGTRGGSVTARREKRAVVEKARRPGIRERTLDLCRWGIRSKTKVQSITGTEGSFTTSLDRCKQIFPIHRGRATFLIHPANTNTRTHRQYERDMSSPRRPRGTLPREIKGHPLSSMVEGGFLAGAGGSACPGARKPELCGKQVIAATRIMRPNHHYTPHTPVTENHGLSDALVMGNVTFFRVRAGSLPGPCRPRFQPVSRGS